MTTAVIDQNRRTRKTISTSFLLPNGYRPLVAHRGEMSTTELNSPGDEERLGRSTEAKNDARDPLSNRPLTFSELLASRYGGPVLLQRYLAKVLLTTADRPDATEATESPNACLPDWAKWHDLRARATAGVLAPSEANELAIMRAQAKILDELAVRRQADAVKPALAEHSRVLASLSSIAKLLERAIEAAEKGSDGSS